MTPQSLIEELDRLIDNKNYSCELVGIRCIEAWPELRRLALAGIKLAEDVKYLPTYVIEPVGGLTNMRYIEASQRDAVLTTFNNAIKD